MQPGDTIDPSADKNRQPETPVAPATAVPEETPAPQSKEPESQWAYNDDNTTPGAPVPGLAAGPDISWTASEFVSHQKGGSWYGLLGVAAALIAIVVYVATRDIISVVMVVVAGIILGVFAARQPRTLQYKITKDGITIGQKLYPYHLFKSFSVMDEGALSSIQLMPLKRFMPAISMYYAPDDERKIADMLSYYLPYEAREHDVVDKFMRKIRF